MSLYSREVSTRPGVSFGCNRLHNHHHPPPRRQHREASLRPPLSSSRIGGKVDNDGGGIGYDVNGNVSEGGISRFGPQRRDRERQQHNQQHHQQHWPPHHRQAASLAIDPHRHREEEEATMFQEIEAPGHYDECDNVPIEGSIHAHHDDVRNFSQVTLSQLSDGPSVRSFRSQHRRTCPTSSQRIVAPPTRCGVGVFGGSSHRGLNQPERRIPRRGEDEGEDEDADSLRSSQPLLSQAVASPQQHRPPSNCGGGGGGERLSSGGAEGVEHPTWKRAAHTSFSVPATRDDDVNPQSQSLLSNMPTSRLAPIAPRRLAGGIAVTMTTTTATSSNHRQQQVPPNKRSRGEDASDVGEQGKSRASSSYRAPGGLLSGLPRPGDYYGNCRATTPAAVAAKTTGCHRPTTPFPPLLPGRRRPTPAVGRTMTSGSMSSTLATSLATPSRVFRSITGLAARTTAGLAALSPFRVNGRIRSTIGSTLLGSAYATSSSSSYSSRGGGPSSTATAITRLGAAGGLSALASSTALRNRSPPGASSADRTSGGLATRDGREIDDSGRIRESHQAPSPGQRSDGQSAISSSMMLDEEGHGDRNPQRGDELNFSPSTGLSDGAPFTTLDDRGAKSTLNVAERRFAKVETREQDRQCICDASARFDSEMRSNQPNHQDESENAGAKSPPSNDTLQTAPRQHEMDLNAANARVAPSQRDGTRSFDTIISNAKDTIRDIQNRTADDDISKGSGTTLDLHGKIDEIIAATRALHHQHDRFEKSKREFIELNERARQEWKEEYGKIEALQTSMHNKYGTLQRSMDDFSTKISSAAHNHEFTMRNLVSTSMNDLRQESVRAAEAISQRHEKNKSQLLADIRALIEIEARKYLSEIMAGMVNTIKSNDTAAIDDDATFDAEDYTVGDSIAGKENMHPCLELDHGEHLQVKALPSEPEMSYKQGSPLCDKRYANNKSLTPLRRGILSASTTPFSRKATPQQSNHANGKLSPQPSNHSRRGIDFDSELRNDLTGFKTGRRGDNSPQDRYSSRHLLQLQNVVNRRNAESKVKVVKEAASSSQSKRLVEVPTMFVENKTEIRVGDGRSERPESEPDVAKFVSKVDKSVTQKNDGSATNAMSKTTQNKSMPTASSFFSPFQDVVGKRGHSDLTNASKSPRRSKRLKEINRVEHMAVPVAPIANEYKSAPSQVTPKDEATSITARDRDDAKDSSSSVVCSSTPGRAGEKGKCYLSVSTGVSTLLGTSVTVPNHGEFEDELIGFEDSDDGFRPEKGSLASFLPFGGFRIRTKGCRTMSKKKKRSILRYDFDDFNFS